jgi:two-component system, OmpR family, sensor histidine kinase CiaH
MFKKLRNRFLILNMSIISVVMIVAFAAIYSITYNNTQTENQNKLHNLPAMQVMTYGGSAGEGASSSSSTNVKLKVRNIPADYSLSFSLELDTEGKLVNIESYIDMPDETYQKAAEIAWNNQKDDSTINLNGKIWQYTLSPDNYNYSINENGQPPVTNTINTGYRVTFLDVTESLQTLRQLLVTFIIVGLAMLVIILIISLYFANRAIKPIAEAWEKQKQFVADASHELKTPLAIINANSDALLANQEETIKNQKKWLDYIKVETGRMTKLINNMLYLAKAENANVPVVHTTFDFSNVVNSVILSMEAVAFEKGIQLSQTIEPDIMAKGDPEQIQQVVVILLDNAIKYTNDKGHIDISVKKMKHQAVFSIQNNGKGIKKRDLPRIFDRFYRPDPSRTQDSGGFGLGLSVARAILDKMGGKISATSVENESTTFTFTLGV